MNAAASSFGGLNLVIEAIVAVVVPIVLVIRSLFTLRGELIDVEPWHVHLGAGIYGLVFGVVVGFVIVPLRLFLVSGQAPPQVTGWAGFGFIAVMIVLRRGLLGRLPFLGPQVRAYRRASLRRAIAVSKRQLEKLTPKTDALQGAAE
jgi:hypothetical protein